MAERYLPPTDHWKTYEADNGEQFKLDMSRIGPWLNERVIVYEYEVGVDISPNIVTFFCNGYYENEADPIQIAPPHSVMGAIASDVCRIAQNKAKPTPNPTPKPTQPDVWQTFTSPDGRFSVLITGTPQQSSVVLKLDSGGKSTEYILFFPDNNDIDYSVYDDDYRQDALASSPQVFLKEHEYYTSLSQKPLTDAAINLNGVPGRAFTFMTPAPSSPSGNALTYARVFLAGTHLYTLEVVTPSIPLKSDTAAQADQFMNSFRILDNPPQP
jgi:hypothetical protein